MPAILADTLAVLRAHTDHSVEWELDGQRLPVSFIALQGGSTIIELVDGNDVTTVNCDTGTIRLVMGEVYPEIPETGGPDSDSAQPSGGRFSSHPGDLEFFCYGTTAEFFMRLRSSARPDIVANGVLVHRAEGPPTEYEVFFEQDVSKDEATIILLTFTYWTLHHAGFGVGVEPSRGLAHTPTYRGGDAYTWRDSTLTWRGRVQRIRVFVGGEPSIGVTDLDGQTATLPILSRSMEAFGTIPELRSDECLHEFGPFLEFCVGRRGRDFFVFWNQFPTALFTFDSNSGAHQLKFAMDVPDEIALMIFVVATEYFF